MFLKINQNWFYLIEQASDMSKITLSVIVYAWCLNKTTINTYNKTNEQFSSHFFLVHPILWTKQTSKIFRSIAFFVASVFVGPKKNWNNPIIQWVIQKKWQLTSFIVGLYFWFIQTMSINYDWNCDFWNARSLFYQIKSILILFQLLKIGQKISTSYCLCYMRYAKRYAKNCTLHSLDQRTLFWMTLYLI